MAKLSVERTLRKAISHERNGQMDEARKCYDSILELFPGNIRAKQGLAKLSQLKPDTLAGENPSDEILHQLTALYNKGQIRSVIQECERLTKEFPQSFLLWNLLGAAFKAQSKLEEAIAAYNNALLIKPGFAEAHNNIGSAFQSQGKFEKASAAYNKALLINPDYAKAHYNLGVTLKELGRLEEAEASYSQAIALKPDYALAHNNLGVTLKDLGRLAEAQASYTQAIALKPDYAEAHSSLGVVLHMNGDIDSGLESLEKANNIDPDLQNNHIILAILKARKALGITEFSADNISNLGYSSEQFPQPVILNRAIEAELISSLYKMKSIELSKFDNSSISDPRFGNGKCSRDFKLFKDDSPIIKSVAEDLTIIMREVVKSDIYIAESFFNIFGAGGGSTPHKHIGKLDADEYLNFGKQKYSLVYYLSVGDQNCMDPGILKLYDPSEDILPYEGMIAIFPADRKHSSIYGGKKDRVMIGVNFYSL